MISNDQKTLHNLTKKTASEQKSLLKLFAKISLQEQKEIMKNQRSTFHKFKSLNIENYDEYKNIKIPKFSIQLLVENAIKHGYLSEILNIDIKFLKDKIIVENDGKITKEINFGTGLTNLKSRLKLQKIGTLSANVLEDKMQFVIELK